MPAYTIREMEPDDNPDNEPRDKPGPIELMNRIAECVPGENHHSTITDRGARSVCHSTSFDGSLSYVAYVEATDLQQRNQQNPGNQKNSGRRDGWDCYRSALPACVAVSEAPIVEAPDDVASQEMVTDLYRVIYLRAFADRFEAGRLYENLCLSMRGEKATIKATIKANTEENTEENRDQCESRIKQIEDFIHRRLLRQLADEVLTAQEHLQTLHDNPETPEHHAKKTSDTAYTADTADATFWRMTESEAVDNLKQHLPDPVERERLVALHRLRRAGEADEASN